MLFSTLSVLGFVAAATAAPHLHSRFEKDVVTREALTPAARGLSWTPRAISPRGGFSNSRDFGNSFNLNSIDANALNAKKQINILQLQEQKLQQLQLQQELILVQAIQEQLLAQAELQFAVDNIRKNTFNALNQNVNTVLVIVTQVVDNRDSKKKNTRYMVRQQQSNSRIQEQVFVIIQEQATMTINNIIPSKVDGAAQATETGSSSEPAVGSYTPGGNVSLNSEGMNLLPYGVSTPSFANAQGFNDPALIIQSNQKLFVQEDDNQNRNQFSVAQRLSLERGKNN